MLSHLPIFSAAFLASLVEFVEALLALMLAILAAALTAARMLTHHPPPSAR